MKKSKKFLKVLSATAIAAIMATTMASTAAFAAVGDDLTLTKQYVEMPDNLTNAEYSVYKVASAEVANGKKYYNYRVESAFGTYLVAQNGNLYLKGGEAEGNTLLTQDTAAATLKNLANALNGVSGKTPMEFTVGEEQKTVLPSNTKVQLDPGYYLITVSGVTASPMLISVSSADDNTESSPRDLKAKGSSVTFDKKITGVVAGTGTNQYNGEKANDGHSAYGAAGSTVSFELNTQTPNYDISVKDKSGDKIPTNYTITDIPENTLTIDTDSITVKVAGTPLTKGTGIDSDKFYADEARTKLAATLSTANSAIKSDTTSLAFDDGEALGTGFQLVFEDDYILAVGDDGKYSNQGKDVVVTFSATLSDTPDTGIDSNNNYGQVKFDNDFFADNDVVTADQDVKLYSAEVDVTKTKEDDTALADAEFTLYQAKTDTEGNTVADETKLVLKPTATGTGSNEFKFQGLSAGKYVLVETKVPTGYKQANDVVFEIKKDGTVETGFTGNFTYKDETGADLTGFTSDKGVLSGAIKNIKGQTLPGTGGVGTTMFTIGGIALVVVAGGMLTIYMKKRKTSEEE